MRPTSEAGMGLRRGLRRSWTARVTWEITDFGDSALRVLARHDDPETRWSEVHRLAVALNHRPGPGVRSAAATYESLLVEFDPSATSHDEVAGAVWQTELAARGRPGASTWSSDALPGLSMGDAPATFVVPVVYDGQWGPDLVDVAQDLSTTPEHVVAAHEATSVRVRCLSHSAAPMMDGPDIGGEVGRLHVPRVRVVEGSILLAGRQSLVLTVAQPSGWRVIGRTPIRLVSRYPTRPVGYRPGDVFRFRRIDDADWGELSDLTLEDCRAAD